MYFIKRYYLQKKRYYLQSQDVQEFQLETKNFVENQQDGETYSIRDQVLLERCTNTE